MNNPNTIAIHQALTVKDWPLAKAGDSRFFGYVVAMGVFPMEWGDSDGMFHYADFAYNDSYERYALPVDDGLKIQLWEILWDNLNGVGHAGDIYGKVWITRREKGYEVSLP